MRTNFSEVQRQDPRLAEADRILRKCVHCGFCAATCPSYVLLGDERDSPRGRIDLIKEMFEGGRGASRQVAHHVDRCLSCRACVTACPSEVDTVRLFDLARAHIEQTHQRPPKQRMLRGLLAAVLPDPGKFRRALWAACLVRPARSVFRYLGLEEIAAMLELAPSYGPRTGRLKKPGIVRARGTRRKRVALFTGCVQQSLRPEINDATIRLLRRHGADIVISGEQVCCGALLHNLGRENDVQELARQNVDAWSAVFRKEPLDAIIVNASACEKMLADFGQLLSRDQGYVERAGQVAALTEDIAVFLHGLGLEAPQHWSGLKVAYLSPCSTHHGPRRDDPAPELLAQCGYTLVEIPEGHMCCGSAGSYNILQPKLAGELRDRKLRNIERVAPDVVATGNIGCLTQLRETGRWPVVHMVELLDWAHGGPCPIELKPYSDRVRTVRDLINEGDGDRA